MAETCGATGRVLAEQLGPKGMRYSHRHDCSASSGAEAIFRCRLQISGHYVIRRHMGQVGMVGMLKVTPFIDSPVPFAQRVEPRV